jgi:hypothetical protein
MRPLLRRLLLLTDLVLDDAGDAGDAPERATRALRLVTGAMGR